MLVEKNYEVSLGGIRPQTPISARRCIDGETGG